MGSWRPSQSSTRQNRPWAASPLYPVVISVLARKASQEQTRALLTRQHWYPHNAIAQGAVIASEPRKNETWQQEDTRLVGAASMLSPSASYCDATGSSPLANVFPNPMPVNRSLKPTLSYRPRACTSSWPTFRQTRDTPALSKSQSIADRSNRLPYP